MTERKPLRACSVRSTSERASWRPRSTFPSMALATATSAASSLFGADAASPRTEGRDELVERERRLGVLVTKRDARGTGRPGKRHPRNPSSEYERLP